MQTAVIEQPKKRGGARPGAGRPKGSRNAVSVKTRREIADEFAAHARSAMDVLVAILNDELEDANGDHQPASLQARSNAADRILDRGIGKAVSQVELTGADGKDLIPEDTTNRLSGMTPEQLAMMKQLLITMATPTQPGDEAVIIDQEDEDDSFLD